MTLLIHPIIIHNYITRVPPPFDTNILLGSQSLVVTWADKIWFSLVPGTHRNWRGRRGSSTWVASYTHLHLILIAEVIANLLHFLIQQLLACYVCSVWGYFRPHWSCLRIFGWDWLSSSQQPRKCRLEVAKKMESFSSLARCFQHWNSPQKEKSHHDLGCSANWFTFCLPKSRNPTFLSILHNQNSAYSITKQRCYSRASLKSYIYPVQTFWCTPVGFCTLQRFALTLQNWNAQSPNHKIN